MATHIVADSKRYEHLEERPGSFYREPFIKGVNLRASRLVAWMQAESLSPEQAAADRNLPLPAVLEAMLYVDNNAEFLAEEQEREHQLLCDRGLLDEGSS
jgi:uncharacterized protein (DUF433 family)